MIVLMSCADLLPVLVSCTDVLPPLFPQCRMVRAALRLCVHARDFRDSCGAALIQLETGSA